MKKQRNEVTKYYQNASDEEKTILWAAVIRKIEDFDKYHDDFPLLFKMDVTPYKSKVYQKILSVHSSCHPIPLVEKIPDDAPVNFIWIGSLLPDRHLENIRRTANCTPRREVVLWKDRSLLTPEQDRQMQQLPKLAELKEFDIKVLDINDVDLDQALPSKPESGHSLKEIIDFVKNDVKNFAIVSDIVRYALLVLGSEVIDKADNKQSSRPSSAMIYMDTDRGPDDIKPVKWGSLTTPCGFLSSNDNNDTLATAYKEHPVFIQALLSIAEQYNGESCLKEILEAFNTYSRPAKITITTEFSGPDLLDRVRRKTLGYPVASDYELISDATGSEVCDMTWLPTAPEYENSNKPWLSIKRKNPVDFTASWPKRLPS